MPEAYLVLHVTFSYVNFKSLLRKRRTPRYAEELMISDHDYCQYSIII